MAGLKTGGRGGALASHNISRRRREPCILRLSIPSGAMAAARIATPGPRARSRSDNDPWLSLRLASPGESDPPTGI